MTVNKSPIKITARLQQLTAWLEEAHAKFSSDQRDESLPSYAAEWILDNYYIIQQAIRQIEEDLPDTYYRELPKLTTAATGAVTKTEEGQNGQMSMQGFPRVYALAHGYLSHEKCQVDSLRLRRFVVAYQQVTPLTMGELWALPIMFRLALLEELARSAGRLVQLFAETPMFTVPTIKGLRDEEIVARAIPSLRILNSQSWQEFFEQVSLVHKTLCAEPAQLYAKMDFVTRDHYRAAIESLALATGLDEIAVTQTAVELAQRACDDAAITTAQLEEEPYFALRHLSRTCHVGYYLVDSGRELLEEKINYRARGLLLLRRLLLRHPTGSYLGGVTLLTLLLVVLSLWYTIHAAGGPLLAILVILLVAIPASTVAINLFNGLLTRFLPPRLAQDGL
ncbi:MAG: hypothetical protein R2867_10800 [Caldilineaceae bacterium]